MILQHFKPASHPASVRSSCKHMSSLGFDPVHARAEYRSVTVVASVVQRGFPPEPQRAEAAIVSDSDAFWSGEVFKLYVCARSSLCHLTGPETGGVDFAVGSSSLQRAAAAIHVWTP